MNPSFRPLTALLILVLLMLVIASNVMMVAPVSAASIVVNSAADIEEDDGLCTLREAIHNAKFDTQIFSGPGECAAGTFGVDTISFDGDYIITLDESLGQLEAANLTIIGRGADKTIIQAATCNPVLNTCSHNHRVFLIGEGSTVTFDSVTIRHGQAKGDDEGNSGGGIYNSQGLLYIINSVVIANRADFIGGGIHNLYDSSLFITNSMLRNNSADFGGGIFNLSDVSITSSSLVNNRAKLGGGILNAEATLIVNGSTIANNSATISGGGIANQGIVWMANSTLSGNSAEEDGGAIANDVSVAPNGTLNLKNTTIYGNSAGARGGGIYLAYNVTYNSVINFWNTIISNSTNGGDCYATDPANIGTKVNNLVADGSCGGTPGNPKLGPLANYGGPTLTHALLIGSPAIDAGDPAICAADPVNNLDQRGIVRPQGAGCDIGAFEWMQKAFLFMPLIVR